MSVLPDSPNASALGLASIFTVRERERARERKASEQPRWLPSNSSDAIALGIASDHSVVLPDALDCQCCATPMSVLSEFLNVLSDYPIAIAVHLISALGLAWSAQFSAWAALDPTLLSIAQNCSIGTTVLTSVCALRCVCTEFTSFASALALPNIDPTLALRFHVVPLYRSAKPHPHTLTRKNLTKPIIPTKQLAIPGPGKAVQLTSIRRTQEILWSPSDPFTIKPLCISSPLNPLHPIT
ncbi:uncharacterized protein PAN0_013c4639 [Moesziomyces antarcticus]|uniref:Uncharacterized protein n=1 Tax=Pseudozyma antarctica TaxID=84753 RepID=A0A081CIC1_PSEA2|nr:uncharacterized protein PAN0_013c4639 [Moesziomyces antarcticus]GAK66417.1 hypothetical protein PAN0_013c4639 [Moesziomyces antarcticus]